MFFFGLVLVLSGCELEEIQNPNAPAVESFNEGASQADIQLLAAGKPVHVVRRARPIAPLRPLAPRCAPGHPRDSGHERRTTASDVRAVPPARPCPGVPA